MFIVRKGDKITCSKPHVLGSVTEDIPVDRPITAHELRIDLDVADFAPGTTGHICRECRERVTELRDGVYRVHTSQGWVGNFK